MNPNAPRRLALALVLVAALVAGCSSSDDSADGEADAPASTASNGASVEPADGSWEFTDDRGKKIELDEVPDVVVAQSVAAGGLWEYGIVAKGVFGQLQRADGSPDPAIGLADPADFESLGAVDGEINFEALAALQPDIIVTSMWDEDTYNGINDDDVAVMEQIAPIVGIRVDDRPVTEPLERFAELAESLGADADGGPVAEARAEFDRASSALTAASEAKPDLLVGALSGSLNEMHVAYPPGFPDLQYFQSLGVNFVVPVDHPGAGGFWETLSWEQAGKYPVDLVLGDSRAGALEDLLKQVPASARALPAVAAGQITEWHASHAYGYGDVARVIDELTAAITAADPRIID